MGVSESVPSSSLAPNDFLLVEGTGVSTKGRLVEATDTVLHIRVDAYPSEREIPWSAVRRISRRAGRERKWWIPTLLALLFGGVLGAAGWLLDEAHRSSSGSTYGASQWLLLFAAIGALIGAILGTLIAFALRGPWWDPIYVVPDDAIIASEALVEARLAAGAVSDEVRQAHADRSYNSSFIAWVILALLVISAWGWCAQMRGG
jgi:hypothetical protein